jgi:hypothetical protein
MTDIIKRHQPIIIIELGDYCVPGSCESQEIVDWLADKKFDLFEFSDGEITPHKKKQTYQYCNLLFLPR